MSARFVGLIAWLATGLFTATTLAAPVMAQTKPSDLTEAQSGEMLCVYDQLVASELFYDVADSYLALGDVDATSTEGKELKALEQGCTAKHGWDKPRSDLATAIAIVGASSDLLEEEDLFDMTDEQINAVFKTIDEISDEDYDAFFGGAWAEDEALQARVAVLLGKNGFPTGDKDVTYSGALLMEVNIIGAALIGDWIERFLR
jgi:hypothetical protein